LNLGTALINVVANYSCMVKSYAKMSFNISCMHAVDAVNVGTAFSLSFSIQLCLYTHMHTI